MSLFQLHPLETLYESFSRNDFNWIVYNRLEDSLFKETERVFYTLRERYPEAGCSSEQTARTPGRLVSFIREGYL